MKKLSHIGVQCACYVQIFFSEFCKKKVLFYHKSLKKRLDKNLFYTEHTFMERTEKHSGCTYFEWIARL